MVRWNTDDRVLRRTYHWIAAGEDGVAGWYDCLVGVSAGFLRFVCGGAGESFC
jgi:hypothetical protein